MKEEKEVIWLIRLHQSNFCKGIFNKKNACIRDFEIVCNVNETDKTFRNWIKNMKEIGIIEFVERKNNGGYGRTVDHFVVNRELILKRLRNFDSYYKIAKFFDSITLFGVDK